MSTVLILGSFNMMQSGAKTFECADGYKITVPGTLLNIHTAACAKNPEKKCCECVFGQAICNIEHGGLKPGSFPKYCNTACYNATSGFKIEGNMRRILSHLKAQQGKNIPVKDFWGKVTRMLHQQGFYDIP